jgi:hypothetical protein
MGGPPDTADYAMDGVYQLRREVRELQAEVERLTRSIEMDSRMTREAIVAIETKVGIDDSPDPTSLDYKIRNHQHEDTA